jgi:hypothetical protein
MVEQGANVIRFGRFGFGLAGLVAGSIAGLIVHSSASSPVPTLQPRPAPALPMHVLVDNERPLTAEDRANLGHWFANWRDCVREHKIQLPAAKAQGNALVLRLPAKYAKQPPPPSYLQASLKCGDAAGGPPAGSSLVVRSGVMRLYKPKACLLPVKRSS